MTEETKKQELICNECNHKREDHNLEKSTKIFRKCSKCECEMFRRKCPKCNASMNRRYPLINMVDPDDWYWQCPKCYHEMDYIGYITGGYYPFMI
jgi:hypothetical protein